MNAKTHTQVLREYHSNLQEDMNGQLHSVHSSECTELHSRAMPPTLSHVSEVSCLAGMWCVEKMASSPLFTYAVIWWGKDDCGNEKSIVKRWGMNPSLLSFPTLHNIPLTAPQKRWAEEVMIASGIKIQLCCKPKPPDRNNHTPRISTHTHTRWQDK